MSHKGSKVYVGDRFYPAFPGIIKNAKFEFS